MKHVSTAAICLAAGLSYAPFCTAQTSGDAVELPEMTVRETPSLAERNALPGTTESMTGEQVRESINLINAEDALKYFPGLAVRKRNAGDQFAPLATRTSGLGQSARSLIYADGILLSSLVGNNNSNATPRWSMVSPAEIERVEVIYGPFAAAYAGNSMGAVVEYVTRMPTAFEGTADVVSSKQHFGLYGTRDDYTAGQLSFSLGNRSDALSWRVSGSHLQSATQPVNLITLPRPATPGGAGTPVSGAYADYNRTGAPIEVIGAGGLERKSLEHLKFRLAYDVTPEWLAAYTLGWFQNDVEARVQTYLRDAAGNPVYAGNVNISGYNYNIGAASFSSTSGRYQWAQEHVSHSASMKSSTQGRWDWEFVASWFEYLQDQLRHAATTLPGAESGGAGTMTDMGNTGWQTTDLKGYWRPNGMSGPHQVSFGFHQDAYRLSNMTYSLASWFSSTPAAVTAEARGRTRTRAVWAQDAWRIGPFHRLTVGGRAEQWEASDGRNYSAAPASDMLQPSRSATRFSPKATLIWDARPDVQAGLSYGVAYRFPTVSELYQAVTTSGVIYTPTPTLRPEQAHSTELRVEQFHAKGRTRVSVFQEDLADALIPQNATVAGTTAIASSVQNIDRIRSRGIELVGEASDAMMRGLDVFGSVTFVDSEIRANPAFRNAAGVLTDVRGKYTPNIARTRASATATYRHDEHWSGALGARYSTRVWATMDNTDVYTHTFQGFDPYVVLDTRINYQLDRNTRASVGIDNLNNRRYFLFHPFPQRTVMAELRYAVR